MDFITAGTLQSYTKFTALKMRWDLKRQSGDVSAHTDSLNGMLTKTPAASAAQEQLDAQEASQEDRLKTIMEKVYAGKTLTREEKEYLKEKNPRAYLQIQSAEQERKAYEQELKRCRTKEDVQRAKTARLSASLTRVNAVMNNPAIPEEKKLEIVGIEKGHCEKMEASTRAFVKRGEYAKLPTDAEKARAEKEEREKEAARRGQASEKKEAVRREQAPKKSERREENSGSEETRRSETDASKRAEANETRVKSSVRKSDTAARTESDVVRKVRRAKRRAGAAAYTAAMNLTDEPSQTVGADA